MNRIDMNKHHFDLITTDLCPISSAAHGAGPKARKFEKAEVDKKLCIHVIDPTQSEKASPIELAPKTGRSIQLCIDYRKQSAVKVKEAYAMP